MIQETNSMYNIELSPILFSHKSIWHSFLYLTGTWWQMNSLIAGQLAWTWLFNLSQRRKWHLRSKSFFFSLFFFIKENAINNVYIIRVKELHVYLKKTRKTHQNSSIYMYFLKKKIQLPFYLIFYSNSGYHFAV